MKMSGYTQEQIGISTLMKALDHPARVAILEHLLKVEDCICGRIVDILPLAQPTVSQHLKELRNANLIKGSVEGNTICYCVDEKGIEKLTRYFDKVKEILKTSNIC